MLRFFWGDESLDDGMGMVMRVVDKAWKVDMAKLTHEVAQSSQHIRQVVQAAVALSDVARRADLNIIAALKAVEDGRERGSVEVSQPTSREVLKSLGDAIPSGVVPQQRLRQQADRLLHALGTVTSLEALQRWYLDQLTAEKRRRRSIATYRQPGIVVSGAIFEPLNADDPKENGEALTLRIQTAEDGVLPTYMNLGSLILLALIGSRVVALQVSPRDDDDGDDGWSEDDGLPFD